MSNSKLYMEQLQVFNFEENNVRTLTIDDEPHFIGKDVADVLGYSRPDHALTKHVDDEDKLMYQIDTSGQKRNMYLINESGLYSLIFGSQLASAKRFKRWITSEVLPQIRQTGRYETPKDPMELLQLHYEAQKKTDSKVNQLSDKVTHLESEVKLDAGEYGYLTKMINRTVMETLDILGFTNTMKVRQVLFRDINSGLNELCGVRTRTQLKQKHFDTAVDYVQAWSPSTSSKFKVKQLATDLKEGD